MMLIICIVAQNEGTIRLFQFGDWADESVFVRDEHELDKVADKRSTKVDEIARHSREQHTSPGLLLNTKDLTWARI
jgi:hypothetical protein